MKRFAVLIVKPDAINKKELSIIGEALKRYNFLPAMCFKFENFYETMLKYRKADVLFKNAENAQEEIRYCGIALNAYKEAFPNGIGLALLLPMGEDHPNKFFETMQQAKREIREKIESDRGYYYVYTNCNSTPKLQCMPHQEYRHKKQLAKKDFHRAYVNAIHFEDYECFTNNFCLAFMVSNGVICKQNKTDFTTILQNSSINSEPEIKLY